MVPPAPGRIPTKMPISEERARVVQLRKMVLIAARCSMAMRLELTTMGFKALSLSRRSLSNWLNANRPTSTGRKSNPWRSESKPKVNRATPLTSSSPMAVINSPSTPAMTPLTRFSPARLAVMVSANTTSEK